MKNYFKSVLKVSAALTFIVSGQALANSFVISGVVPDRGFSIQTTEQNLKKIELQENSELKVYVKDLKPARGPASLDSGLGSAKWTRLTQAKNINTSSHVRVEAP